MAKDTLSLSTEIARSYLPALEPDRHKYRAGQLLLIGGEPGMEGAALLAAAAAYRSGLGLVRWLAQPGSQRSLLLPEMIQVSMGEKAAETLKSEMPRTRALLVGVGCSPEAPSHWVIEALQMAQNHHIPIIFDGGSLHWIHAGWIAPCARDLLTPHHGELSILLGASTNNPLTAAEVLAGQWDCTVIAKGPSTYIVSPGQQPISSSEGDPGMATAGSGDVLAGILGGLTAQGVPAAQAAALAVWIHSYAGRSVAEEKTSYSTIASDLIHDLPKAFRALIAHR
jgi:ADP-dependent NAD(P)H-hydrate dehydratase